MQFNIVDVSVETIARGKAKYSIATVAYTYNGEQRSKKIMSFANPSVFKAVQEMIGNTVEVQVGKNEQGYDEWKSISLVGVLLARVTRQHHLHPQLESQEVTMKPKKSVLLDKFLSLSRVLSQVLLLSSRLKRLSRLSRMF